LLLIYARRIQSGGAGRLSGSYISGVCLLIWASADCLHAHILALLQNGAKEASQEKNSVI